VVLVTLALFLELEVVDGALAATRLFGGLLSSEIRAADVALRPLFMATGAVVFYGGAAFMLLACADFAPSLLAPGRIEHLLSLPIRRAELLLGTYLGILALTALCGLYAAGGLSLILGVKTGVWTWGPIHAALLAAANFAPLYAAMLCSAVLVRSAALSSGAGWLLFVAGLLAGERDKVRELFSEGVGQALFDGVSLLLPRVSTLGGAAIELAAGQPLDGPPLWSVLTAFAAFSLALVSLAIWRFERRDF
jgi:Cu-processing system permease protein